MKKGFLAIVLVISVIPSFFQILGIHNEIHKGIQDMKKELILHQMINERTYELENGFEEAVRRGLEETSKEIPTQERIFLICKKIETWASNFEDVNFRVGYIRRDNYEYEDELNLVFDLFANIKGFLNSDWKYIIEEKISPCVNFVNIDEDAVVIMDNRFLEFDLDPNIVLENHAVAFVFEVNAYKARFKVLIPEGRRIE